MRHCIITLKEYTLDNISKYTNQLIEDVEIRSYNLKLIGYGIILANLFEFQIRRASALEYVQAVEYDEERSI